MINKRDLHFNIMKEIRELEKEFNRAPMALLLLNLNEEFDYDENTVKNGIDELLNISGIGQKTFDEIKEYITL